MGFRFRKSIKVGKNTRINLSKSGVGLSSGVKGARVSVNQKGTRTTFTAPGTGVSHVSYKSHGSNKSSNGTSSNVDNTQETKLMPKAKVYWNILIPLFGILTVLSLTVGIATTLFWGIVTFFIFKKVKSPENQANIIYNTALKEKDADNKIKLLLDAKELDNNNGLVNNALAISYFQKEDYKNTLKCIDDMETINPESLSSILSIFLTAAFQEGEHQKIIDNVESIMDYDLMLQLAVALAYKELGQIKKASEILAAGPVRKRTYDDIVLTYKYYLGICYLEMGEKSKALTQLKKVYEIDSSFMKITQYAKDLGFALGEHIE